MGVVLEGLVGHDGAEVGAADADVDDVPDGLAGVAEPGAGADLVGEGGHLVEDGVDFGDDVFAVDFDGFGFGGAEGDVEDGAVFGGVDLLAGEHGFGVLLEAGFFGELEEEGEGFVGDAVLGVVEEEAAGFGGEAGAAGGVGVEEIAELLGADGFGVLLKGFPGWAGGQGGDLVRT